MKYVIFKRKQIHDLLCTQRFYLTFIFHPTFLAGSNEGSQRKSDIPAAVNKPVQSIKDNIGLMEEYYM